MTLAARLDTLEQRVVPHPVGPTFASIHVQTDDGGAVERAVHKVLPRLGRSAGTNVTGPRNGWVAVHDELCDRQPRLLQRLARELSYSLAAVVLAIGVEEGAVVRYNLWDRGSDVDEYLSVPEYFGELPPGDVVALGANPTVVARLTGADPARVREVARTAGTPAELPPATELVEAIAEVMGVAEAGHGWDRRVMLTLYDAARCPYCARVRIVLAEKDVEYETIEIDLVDRPPWIYEKNSTGRVPVLEEDALGAAGVGRDHGVPRGALPGAGAARRRSRRLARSRACGSSGTTSSPRPYYALRRGEDGAARRFDEQLARLDDALATVPVARRRRVRPRRHRIRALAAARARPRSVSPSIAHPRCRGGSSGWRAAGDRRRGAVVAALWRAMSDSFPHVVDAAWLAEHLGEDGLVVGDVRGPNAHSRGHIPGSRPLVLGSPPPVADEATVRGAREGGRRCACAATAITGDERLVLVRPRRRRRRDARRRSSPSSRAIRAVAILSAASPRGPASSSTGLVELEPVRAASLEPRLAALPTRARAARRGSTTRR